MAALPRLPTPLAIAIHEFVRDEEQRDLTRLWRTCDAVEVLLRFVAALRVGAASRAGWLRANADPAWQIARRLKRPTLNDWYVLACGRELWGAQVTGLPGLEDAVLKPIRRFMGQEVERSEIDHRKYQVERCFTDLRNRLAHGAGLSDSVSERLIAVWQPKCEHLLQQVGPWLAAVQLAGQGHDGAMIALNGIAPRHPGAPGSDSANHAAQPAVDGAGHVFATLSDGGDQIALWPLLRYEAASDDNAPQPRFAVELFARLDSRNDLLYTSLGSDQVDWSLHAGASLKGLDDLLASALLSPPQSDHPDAVSSFEPEFAEDAERFVGRQSEVDALTERLGRSAPGDRLLWLHGTAGMGKSFLVARLFETLRANATANSVLIPYRFRRGDPRCSSAVFAELVCAALDNRLADTGRKRRAPSDRFADLNHVAALTGDCVKQGLQPVFLIDGLDELQLIDDRFAKDVIKRATHLKGSIWLVRQPRAAPTNWKRLWMGATNGSTWCFPMASSRCARATSAR